MENQMENQIIKFIKKVLSHFTSKINHSYLITSDFIQLDLSCDEEWKEFELRALKFICKKESKNFRHLLEWANIDDDFLISSIPLQNKIRIKWFKLE